MIVETADARRGVEIDPQHNMFGWVFRRGWDPGQWVSEREATDAELGAAVRKAAYPPGTLRVRTDPTLPPDEGRFEQNGRVIGRFKIDATQAPSATEDSKR